MYYELSGQGDKTLLFIHGFGGFGGLWRWQIEHFSKKTRVLTIDLPGHGRTPWCPCTLLDIAEMIVDILDREKIDQVSIVASSFGGLVALTLWQQSPERVTALTLTGAVPKFVGTTDFPAGLTSAGIRKLAAQFEGDLGKVLDMFVRSFSTMQERDSSQYALVKALRKDAILPQREALLGFLDILETADVREVLQTVSVPLQFICGDGDYLCPPAVVEVLRGQYPQARFDIFENGGHGVFLTMPERFNQVVGDFLRL